MPLTFENVCWAAQCLCVCVCVRVFAKALYIAPFYRKRTRALTFKNVCWATLLQSGKSDVLLLENEEDEPSEHGAGCRRSVSPMTPILEMQEESPLQQGLHSQKCPSIVPLRSNCTRALTFENLWQGLGRSIVITIRM